MRGLADCINASRPVYCSTAFILLGLYEADLEILIREQLQCLPSEPQLELLPGCLCSLMTADFMEQWEQFEHNSVLHGLAAVDLTLSCLPTWIGR